SLSRRLTRNEFGSVPYASPERLDSGDVDYGSDLWSLSVMLYEMLTGMQPYHADSTEKLERMIRSRIAPPPAPDPCPEPLRRILMKAMAPHPEVRYATAREFREDIEAFRAGRTVGAMEEDLDATRRTFRSSEAPDDATRRTTLADTVPTSTLPHGRGSGKQRGRWFYAGMRVLAMLVLAVVVWGVASLAGDYFLYQHGQE